MKQGFLTWLIPTPQTSYMQVKIKLSTQKKQTKFSWKNNLFSQTWHTNPQKHTYFNIVLHTVETNSKQYYNNL